MYVPPYFSVSDQDECIAFMQQHPFALLITTVDGVPEATHLPLEVEKRGEAVYLTGHVARNNPQGAILEQKETPVMVVFQGAHAYISSSWYEKPSVPTWNYMAVHAYGKVNPVDDPDQMEKMMRDLLDKYEQFQEKPIVWEAVPTGQMKGLLNGILCFEIELQRIEGKYKLSQNRSPQDREAIVNRLETGGEQEMGVAAAMREIEQNQSNQVFRKTSR